jgi:hypothetical protein
MATHSVEFYVALFIEATAVWSPVVETAQVAESSNSALAGRVADIYQGKVSSTVAQ